MKIVCVIVTYNRLASLQATIAAVHAQTRLPDRIVVVDNSSSDGTEQWLATESRHDSGLSVLRLDQNTGGAGGFHYGIRKAYREGADWIWAMDDDSLPEPDALLELVNCCAVPVAPAAPQIGFYASQVNWKDGSRHEMNVPGPARDWSTERTGCPGTVKIRYSSFVSILISRGAIAKAGLPIKEFFIYGDDVEFTRRITSAGFCGFYVPASKVTHLTPANCGLTMERITRDPANLKNNAFIIRNLVAVNKRENHGALLEIGRILYLLFRFMRNRVPLGIQAPLIVAGIKGFFMRYEKWIEYP